MPCCDQSQRLYFTPLPLYSIPVPLTLVENPFFSFEISVVQQCQYFVCEGCFSMNGKWTLDGFKSKTTISWHLFHETTYLKSYSWRKTNREVWWKEMEEMALLFSLSEELWAACWQLLQTANFANAALWAFFFFFPLCVWFAQVLSRVLHSINGEKCVSEENTGKKHKAKREKW